MGLDSKCLTNVAASCRPSCTCRRTPSGLTTRWARSVRIYYYYAPAYYAPGVFSTSRLSSEAPNPGQAPTTA